MALAVLGLNTFLQTTALIMADPLDLVQRDCDCNHQRSGKSRRTAAIKGDDRHFSIVDSDWNRQEKPRLFFSSLGIFSINTQNTIVL